ncbi:MAG: hypothetical protein WC470_01275 [Candidatus Paceibacterota bacterium]
MENKIYKRIAVVAMIFAIGTIGMQIVSATVPNPGHLLAELECNALFCINASAGTVTIGGTTAVPLVVNGRITSTGTPINSTDVATKGYVDGLLGSGGTMHKVEFTTSGSWTVPAGVTVINVTLVGGGGGGGTPGGGGGGSGYVSSYQLPITSSPLHINVGAGGGGGGGAGGTSFIANSSGQILVWANGGGGGGTPGGGVGRCNGGNGAYGGGGAYAGQCGGGAAGHGSGGGYGAYGGGGGTGYGAGGGGGSWDYGGGGGAGGFDTSVSAGSGQRHPYNGGGAGAPGYVLITY